VRHGLNVAASEGCQPLASEHAATHVASKLVRYTPRMKDVGRLDLVLVDSLDDGRQERLRLLAHVGRATGMSDAVVVLQSTETAAATVLARGDVAFIDSDVPLLRPTGPTGRPTAPTVREPPPVLGPRNRHERREQAARARRR
jgi:hypothetical protein